MPIWICAAHLFGLSEHRTYFPGESLVFLADITNHKSVAAQLAALLEKDPWSQQLDSIREAPRLLMERHNLFSMLSEVIGGAEAMSLPSVVTAEEIAPFFDQLSGPLGRLKYMAYRVRVQAARR